LEVTAAAVAVNVAVVAAAATVTDAGTVTAEVALLERATAAPPAGAACERVTVQVVVADGANVVLVQRREVGVTGVVAPSAVPPDPVIASAAPAREAPNAPETPTVAEVAVDARVVATVATMPSAMTLVFIPETTQITVPEELAQFKFFPAAVRAGPAVTAKVATEPAG
jgi:hypothetical protein